MRTATGDDRDPLDRCFTPRNLARALVRRLDDRGYIAPPPSTTRAFRALDAGAGDGAFYTALEGHRALHRPHLSPIVPYGVDLDPDAVALRTCANVWHGDFLKLPAPRPAGVQRGRPLGQSYDLVIGNPPFSVAEAFVRYGLVLAPVVAFLLPQLFLGSGERFHNGLWGTPARTVTSGADRLLGPEFGWRLAHVDPLVERCGFYGPALKADKQHKTGMVQHCLFIWTRLGWSVGGEDAGLVGRANGDFTSRHLSWGGMKPWNDERTRLVGLDDRVQAEAA